jgi:ubiquinone/menaquinone biosynthesis C-methylase UbiE
MARVSEKKHWDDYWADSQELNDVYANDNRIVEFLSQRMDFNGMRVLEVGAGTGRDSDTIASMGAEVWTLDYSEESLRLMSAHLSEPVRIVCGDALSLPLASDSFDLVFHQGLLEHFRNPGDLLSENYRILKPGGHVLVDVPQRFHYYTLAKHVLMFLDKWFAGWETEFSVGELSGLMEKQGFEIAGVFGHNLYPPIWYRGVRRVTMKAGLRLPMYPLSSPGIQALRRGLKQLVPHGVRLNTSMVIGCLGRKA